MEKRTVALLVIMVVAVFGLSLAGCAETTTYTAPAKTRAEMLREAGFKAYPAATEAERAHLRTCPGETLMIHERPGARACYAFADPATHTMYMGDEAAYWRYKAMLERQEQKILEQRMTDDPEFWNTWGNRYRQ